ncbi:MAG: TIGR04083 family peptide-modifying radical SAM enzyme [Methanoregula sp.]|nr:TIGR04083 family peptide-modifying radical SAM enzyme [Methanoregula sp.]
MKSPFHIMLIPTLGCPAHCSYCWSSEAGSPKMSIDTVKETVAWLKDFKKDQVTITFHGGEPLLGGVDFYRQALPLISEGLSDLKPAFAMQSNLWLLTPDLADILAKYHVPIGTSIDGPERLNDSQRGDGYYKKTMKGYELAKAHGLQVRFICTFTGESVKQKEEIFRFFLDNGFVMKLHPALPSLRSDNPKQWALEPVAYGELLVFLLDKYLENMGRIEIMNINDLCRCVFTRRGSVCTFADCMGNTFAIGPDGSIYPCYRFVGMDEWVMGNVRDGPSQETLANTVAGKRMQAYKEFVDTACRECPHIKYCRGGCPYNAIVPTEGEIRGVDPHCVAYKQIFDELNDRLSKEMFGSDEMDMIALSPFGARPKRASKAGIMTLMHSVLSK